MSNHRHNREGFESYPSYNLRENGGDSLPSDFKSCLGRTAEMQKNSTFYTKFLVAAECKLPLVPARGLSIDPRAHAYTRAGQL